MSLTILKLIAYITMLIDHVGYATGNIYMRMIGRIAFPIFAYLIASGYVNTKNKKKYALNLLVIGIVSEIPYDLFINSSLFYPQSQNVMFTLLFGLFAIMVLDKITDIFKIFYRKYKEKYKEKFDEKKDIDKITEENNIKKDKEKIVENKQEIIKLLFLFPLLFLLIFIPQLLHFDYGMLGVILIVLFHLSKNKPFGIGISLIVFNILRFFISAISSWTIISFISILTTPFLLFVKKTEKPKHYKFFKIISYLFYPAHQLILYFIFK